jgi:hypothetical protein
MAHLKGEAAKLYGKCDKCVEDYHSALDAAASEFNSCQQECADQLQTDLTACQELPPDQQMACREQALANFRACIEHCAAIRDAAYKAADATLQYHLLKMG